MTDYPPTPLSSILEASRKFIEEEHPLFRSLRLATTNISKGEVQFTITIPEEYTDGEYIHPGMFTIMLDTILGYVVWTSMDSFSPIATINLKSDYFESVSPGSSLKIIGQCEGIRNDVAYCTGKALLEESGELIATAAGTFMVGTRSTAKSRL